MQCNYQIFATYIVLALVVAITIHIMFRIYFQTHKKTYTYQNNNILSQNDSNLYQNNDYDYQKVASDNLFEKPASIIKNQNSTLDIDPENDLVYNNYANVDFNNETAVVDNSDYSKWNELLGTSLECGKCKVNNTYEKEFGLLNENQQTSTIYDDLKTYRDDFFNFRNKTMHTSHGADSVDIINDRIQSGNGDIVGVNEVNNNLRIADLYDSMTNNKLIDQNIDETSTNAQYKMKASGGSYLTNDTWLYGDERVMNGGHFYDNVTGLNNETDKPMAL